MDKKPALLPPPPKKCMKKEDYARAFGAFFSQLSTGRTPQEAFGAALAQPVGDGSSNAESHLQKFIKDVSTFTSQEGAGSSHSTADSGQREEPLAQTGLLDEQPLLKKQ